MLGWIDRAPRRVIAIGFSGALALALGIDVGAAATGGSADLQLAQAASPPSSPPLSGAPDQQFVQFKARLGIIPAQQPQFDAFAQVMRQNAAARDAFVRRNPPGRRRDALDPLRVQAEAAEIDARGLQRLLSAFQSLYAALSPQQKQAADQLFAPPPAAR